MLTAMTFNIQVGGCERFPRILQVLERCSPDILVLQECLDWCDQDERLGQVADALGIPNDKGHVLHGRASRRHGMHMDVCAFSRPPITRRKVHRNDAICHCEVEFDVQWNGGLTFVGAHFTAGAQRWRMIEVGSLEELLPARTLAQKPCILMGDLNSLSPHDAYPADFAAHLGGLRKPDKFGNPANFEVLEKLEAHGWHDALYMVHTPPRRPDPWFTAERNGAAGHPPVKLREDYILVSAPMLTRLVDCHVQPYDESVSDHAPVCARFRD